MCRTPTRTAWLSSRVIAPAFAAAAAIRLNLTNLGAALLAEDGGRRTRTSVHLPVPINRFRHLPAALLQPPPCRPSYARFRERDHGQPHSRPESSSRHTAGGKRAVDLSGGERARGIFIYSAVLQLRERIREHGLKSGDYVQIANDTGQKWFMRIVNGEVLFKDTDDPAIASALWCEENDVTKLSSIFTKAQTIAIRCIIDAGPISKFNHK